MINLNKKIVLNVLKQTLSGISTYQAIDYFFLIADWNQMSILWMVYKLVLSR